MVALAYPFLHRRGEHSWDIGRIATNADDPPHLCNYWLPTLAVLNPRKLRLRHLDEALADTAPFVYPLELPWDWVKRAPQGASDAWLTPHVPEAVLAAARARRARILLSYAQEGQP